MNNNYDLRENIWKKFYSQEAIEKFENYTIHLLNQGKSESEIKIITTQYRNEYFNELKKIGLYPEDRCILYGDFEVYIFDKDLTILYSYTDYEYFGGNDDVVSFPLNRKVLGMLINDLLKYSKHNYNIKELSFKNKSPKKSYFIKKFKDHIHLSEKDNPSDFIPIPIFSSKLTYIIKEILSIYNNHNFL